VLQNNVTLTRMCQVRARSDGQLSPRHSTNNPGESSAYPIPRFSPSLGVSIVALELHHHHFLAGDCTMRLLSIAEVARLLGVREARVYELAKSGTLPSVRLGRQVRIDEGRLAEWIRNGGAALPGGWKREPGV
jgi:excisionase family DNA binding protein